MKHFTKFKLLCFHPLLIQPNFASALVNVGACLHLHNRAHSQALTFGPMCARPKTRRVCRFSSSSASHGKQAARLSPATAPNCTAGGVTATRLCPLSRRRSPSRLIAHMFFHLSGGVTQQSGGGGLNFSGTAKRRGSSPVRSLRILYVFQLLLF